MIRLIALVAGLVLTTAPGRSEARTHRAGKVATKLALSATPPRAADREPANERPSAQRGGALYAVVMGPGPKWKHGQPLRRGSDAHYRYWQELYQDGRVASAGPVGQDTGFALLRARNQSDANKAIAADPAVKSGQFRGVARPYAPSLANAGALGER